MRLLLIIAALLAVGLAPLAGAADCASVSRDETASPTAEVRHDENPQHWIVVDTGVLYVWVSVTSCMSSIPPGDDLLATGGGDNRMEDITNLVPPDLIT